MIHIPSNAPSYLPSILARQAQLPVDHAKDGERIELGRVYVVPPDQHLLIEEPLLNRLARETVAGRKLPCAG